MAYSLVINKYFFHDYPVNYDHCLYFSAFHLILTSLFIIPHKHAHTHTHTHALCEHHYDLKLLGFVCARFHLEEGRKELQPFNPIIFVNSAFSGRHIKGAVSNDQRGAWSKNQPSHLEFHPSLKDSTE